MRIRATELAMPERKITEVVAALIWNGNRFMICQRPAHKARGLLWEFVGGKTEPGETKEEALVRECREELGIELEAGTPFFDVVHEYPDITVHLTLFNASVKSGKVQMLEHNDIRWITKHEISDYDFCPADTEILKKISMIPESGEKYRHFKGNEYIVKEVAVATEKPDIVVVYEDINCPGKIWARPIASWLEPVSGKTRFEKI